MGIMYMLVVEVSEMVQCSGQRLGFSPSYVPLSLSFPL